MALREHKMRSNPVLKRGVFMDVKYLNYFLTLVSEKNMTRASEKLFVSQSSLSHYLSRLETEVGTPLFLRGKNELILTPAGELYAETARTVIQLRNKLYKNIANLENRAHIRLATSSQWGIRMIPGLLSLYQKAFPHVTFEFRHMDVDQLYWLLAEGQLDFILVAVPSLDNLPRSAQLIWKEELFFSIPSAYPYTQENPGNSISRRDLAVRFCQTTLLLSRRPTANRILADEVFDEYGRTPSSINEVNGIPLTKTMISGGIGCSFIPSSCKDNDETIHYYHIDPPLYRYNVLMQRENLVLHQPEQFFRSYVANYFQEYQLPQAD